MKVNRPLFWNNINLISILLYPLSLITFIINIIKKIPNKRNFKIKSICVGNLYVGFREKNQAEELMAYTKQKMGI